MEESEGSGGSTEGFLWVLSVLSVRVLSSFGANIVVFWVSRRGDVWCAEISLKRREEEGEIWGAIEWSDAIIAFNHNIFTLVPVEVLYSATINL